ncbi:putative integral membrane protein [Brugia pahangi]
MWLFNSIFFPAFAFLISFSSAHPTRRVGRNDSRNIIQYEQAKLNEEYKRVYENEKKEAESERFVVENFMLQERVSFLPMTSSAMVSIYKRTEFMVLSAGIVLYWVVMVFIGTILIMCCICTRSRTNRDEDGELRKNRREDIAEDA